MKIRSAFLLLLLTAPTWGQLTVQDTLEWSNKPGVVIWSQSPSEQGEKMTEKKCCELEGGINCPHDANAGRYDMLLVVAFYLFVFGMGLFVGRLIWG